MHKTSEQPGNKGVADNELADELSRSAAGSRMVGPEPFFAVGRHTFKELFRKEEQGDRDVSVSGS